MRHPWRWIIGLLVVGFLIGLAIIPGGEKREFEVAEEFDRAKSIITLPTIGPFDLSVTQDGHLPVDRHRRHRRLRDHRRALPQGASRAASSTPWRRSTSWPATASSGSVMKSGKATWFPYIGAVFFFVLVSNLIGLLPLPFGEHHQPAFYAATANLNVTLTLALCTFVFTHYAGVRKNGAFRYFANWAPPAAPPVLKQMIWFIHVISEIFRLISLSVRLFANMLAGHAILAVFFAMVLIFQSYLAAVVPAGRLGAHLHVRDLRGLHPGLHLRHPFRRVHRRRARPGPLTIT